MGKHGYQQFCALARALDVAGDRWTLLIVRELVPGPRRFTDLIDGLPGISRKLLTERLRDLEIEGLIAREHLPPPAARQVYTLTGDGHDLAAAMAPLIGWGARRLGDRQPTQSFHARWPAVAMVGLADRQAVTTDPETWADISSGKIKSSSAIDHGHLKFDGDRRAVERLRRIFSRKALTRSAAAG